MDSVLLMRIFVTWLLIVMKFICGLSTKLAQNGTVNPRVIDRTSTEIQCSDQIITDRKGVITSPQYPDKYPNHISCTWHILANIGDVITIVFHDLDIEESGLCDDQLPCCVFNWVKIGPSLNSTERQYCGQDGLYHPTFISHSTKVWIKFHISSIRNGGRGFKLFYNVGSRRRLCQSDEFKCSEFECIPQTSRCNGFRDCSNGADEEFCSELCPSGKSCHTAFLCYDNHRHCDGFIDCPDFTDELGCGLCSANETRCGLHSDQCYNPQTQRCNRIMDCLNGEDEKDCLRVCPGKILCSSGSGCYSSDERCDGIAQCSDASDEKNCGSDLCNYDRGGFLCGNGRCIREIWKCDRTNDCGDGSDEYNCLRNSVLTAAVMGSLICALLLVIAISCTCRLYSLRALDNQMSSRETMLSRLSQEFLFREPPPSYAVAVGEHCRSLCVENVHYNPCPRRGRRRARRARRVHETRRPSISTVENARNMGVTHQPFNFLFPCSPIVPEMVENIPNPIIAQNNHSNFVSLPDRITSSPTDRAECDNSRQMNHGHQYLQDDFPTVHVQKKPSELEKDQNDSSNISTDAESSFSEIGVLPKAENLDSTSNHNHITIDLVPTENQCPNINVPVITCDISSFQSEHFPVAEGRAQSPDFQATTGNHCDMDTHPLIR